MVEVRCRSATRAAWRGVEEEGACEDDESSLLRPLVEAAPRQPLGGEKRRSCAEAARRNMMQRVKSAARARGAGNERVEAYLM